MIDYESYQWAGRARAKTYPRPGGGWRMKDYGESGETLKVSGLADASDIATIEALIRDRRVVVWRLPRDNNSLRRVYRTLVTDGEWNWGHGMHITFRLDCQVEEPVTTTP